MAIEMTQKRTLRVPLQELDVQALRDFTSGCAPGTKVKVVNYFAGDQRDHGSITLEVNIEARST